jgi:hypothetical protein
VSVIIVAVFSFVVVLDVYSQKNNSQLLRSIINIQLRMIQHPVTGTAIIDLLIFTAIFWMLFTRRNSKQGCPRHHTGNWAPGIAYLPVLLMRWAIVPHKNWVNEHKHNQEEIEKNMLHQSHRYHHHGYHHSSNVDMVPDVMDTLYGQ